MRSRLRGLVLAEFMNALDGTSTRPYLIRALYDWCTDNALTPYIAVMVDETVQVPREYVKNNEIVLNISFDATSSLKLGNDFIEFKARFAGSAREIMVPISRVIAIYARENGQGMAFPAPPSSPSSSSATERDSQSESSASEAPTPAGLIGHSPVGPTLVPASPSSESKVVQLVPDTTPGNEDEGDPPEPPKPRTGKRPPLKRVK